MRFTTSILIAGLFGLSSAAFAATPAEPTSREARMAEAQKDYQAQKAATPMQPKAQAPKAATRHHASAKHVAAKHAVKHHAKVRHAAKA